MSPSNSQAEYFKYRQSLADIEKKKFSDADRKSIEETAESNDIATAGFALLELSAAYHQGLYPQKAGLDLLEKRLEEADSAFAAFLLINVEKFLDLPKDKADKGDLADIEQAQRCISESHPADIGPGERTVIGALASHRRQQAKVCIAQLLVSKKNLTASDKQWALEQARAQGNGKSGDEAKYWQLVTRVIGKRS